MLIGRQAERARIGALLETARRGRTASLVLSGEPGIGKTALLEDACASAAGMRALLTTAVESESALAFAGLHALVRPLIDLLPRLEEPQQRALRLALALAEDEELDLLAVNVGTLSLLAEAASEQPLLIAVDDAHLLDRPSADALAFAARRLQGEELAFLFTARSDEPNALPKEIERLELLPLARDEARRLLEARAEPVAPGSVETLLDVAAGNPLALLELPVSLSEDSAVAATTPERLRLAFGTRLDSLPPSSRLAALLAAAEPDPAVVRDAMARLGLDPGALESVEASGLLRIGSRGIVFRHPLVRSLAYAAASAPDQRAAHRALAAGLSSETARDRRAWHLAAAATEPDESLAADLEENADRATLRGGHAAAARALERAARLSEDREAVPRRLCRAARSAFWAGDADRGVELAEEALATSPDPLTRADALLELASIRVVQGAPYEEGRLLAGIADVATLDPDRAARLLMEVVRLRSAAFDVAGALELTPRLEEIARRAGPWWGPRGLASVATTHLAAGDSKRFAHLIDEIDDPEVLANWALDLLWAERYDEAREALEATLREGRASGNRMRVIWNQACIAHLELRLGRLRQARDTAADAITLGEACGNTVWVSVAKAALAGVQAWQGQEEACRAAAAEVLATAEEAHLLSEELAARSALAVLALGCGRPEEAIDAAEPAARRWHESTLVEPSAAAFVPDLVEACIRIDDRASANLWLDRFRTAAERSNRRWAFAAVARCEGLLQEREAFAEPFERALELLQASPLTPERARCHLAYGERLRRAGSRREARRHLRAAHEAFAAMNALPWVERAALELRATGMTVGPRTLDRRSTLTPQELQIALLVAEGDTNREIAARLYLSPKTIEYHLANAYRKLDVHSRAELARIVGERAETQTA